MFKSLIAGEWVECARVSRSSYGPREQGRCTAEFYTTVNTAYTQP